MRPDISISIFIALSYTILSSIERKEIKGHKYFFLFGLRIIDIVNPVKWWSFVRGYYKSLFFLKHEIEQLMLRLFLCPECEKKCVHCGCYGWGKMLNRDESCSAGKWGPMMKRKEWEQNKKERGIYYMFVAKNK